MICPNCNKDFKNLGAHKRFCGKGVIVDNHIKEQRLSDLITSLRLILSRHPHTLEVRTVEGTGGFVEITARIPVRR